MKCLLLLLVPLGLFASCSTVRDIIGSTKEEQIPFYLPLPTVIAVMPFQNETDDKGISDDARRTFYGHFSLKPYQDVELAVVDEKIAELERRHGKQILQIDPRDVCAAMGCDGLIHGSVKAYARIFAAVYSQMSIEAEIWMIDCRTGREVLRVSDSIRYHGGAIPTSLYGLAFSPIAAAMNLREIQRIRMLNELCHKLNKQIPSPKNIPAGREPVIATYLPSPADDMMTEEARREKAARLAAEGGVFFGKGNYGKASSFYEEALEVLPSPDKYYYLAICHEQMGESEKVLRVLKTGIEKYPTDAMLWKSLGMVHYEKGSTEDARGAFWETVRLNPEDKQAVFFYDLLGR